MTLLELILDTDRWHQNKYTAIAHNSLIPLSFVFLPELFSEVNLSVPVQKKE